MTNTTKYLLIGGAALVGAVFIAKRMAAQQAAASKPTGLAGAVAGITSAVDSLKTVSWRSLSPTTSTTTGKLGSVLASSTVVGEAGGGMYYGPGAADGTAAGADAMGTRQLKPQITADQIFYDRRFAGLKT